MPDHHARPIARFNLAAMIAVCCSLVLALAVSLANARVSSVTIDRLEPFEKVGGYTYVEATMHGTVERDDGSVGEYSVPMILIYPEDGGNGVGVVDWPNTAYYWATGHEDLDEWQTVEFTRRTTDGYLFEAGYTYASVLWSKEVAELFADVPPGHDANHLVRGSIERGTDAWEILRDAARFLRNPAVFEDSGGPLPVDTVLSSGFSQTAAMQNEFLVRGANLDDGVPVYDGHMLQVTGLVCFEPNDEPPFYGTDGPCADVPSGHHDAPVIVVTTQTDAKVLGAAFLRNEDDPYWRQYELTGVSHLPTPISPGLSDVQNPVDPRPVVRAAFRNLARWATTGTMPPPSKFIEATIGEGGEFNPTLDADGNAVGGLRLPHLDWIIDGEVAGAPFGTYSGLNPTDPENILLLISGTFTPFSEEELRERYPDHETYVDRVTRAADHLLDGGYILEQDRDAYVAEAEQHSIGDD